MPELGALHRDAPAGSIRLWPASTQFAVDRDEIARYAAGLENTSQLIDSVALGDAGEIERDRSMFACAFSNWIKLKGEMGWRSQPRTGRCDGVGIGNARSWPEAPGRDEVADADVEGSVGKPADLQRRRQYGCELAGHVDPCPCRRPIEPHKVGVWLPGGHLAVDRIHGPLESEVQISEMPFFLREEHRRIACPHSGTTDHPSDEVGFSTHLRDKAPCV